MSCPVQVWVERPRPRRNWPIIRVASQKQPVSRLWVMGTSNALRIAVAGGTGVVGRYVVRAALAAGHEPVVISRSAGVDLLTGAGLAGALEGAGAVIDVSNTQT